MTDEEILSAARETVAAMSEREGWGADEAGLRSGARDNDHRVRIAAEAIRNALNG